MFCRDACVLDLNDFPRERTWQITRHKKFKLGFYFTLLIHHISSGCQEMMIRKCYFLLKYHFTPRGNSTLEQWCRWRSVCRAVGVSLPPDLAVNTLPAWFTLGFSGPGMWQVLNAQWNQVQKHVFQVRNEIVTNDKFWKADRYYQCHIIQKNTFAHIKLFHYYYWSK